jgi:hypothetical protein
MKSASWSILHCEPNSHLQAPTFQPRLWYTCPSANFLSMWLLITEAYIVISWGRTELPTLLSWTCRIMIHSSSDEENATGSPVIHTSFWYYAIFVNPIHLFTWRNEVFQFDHCYCDLVAGEPEDDSDPSCQHNVLEPAKSSGRCGIISIPF